MVDHGTISIYDLEKAFIGLGYSKRHLPHSAEGSYMLFIKFSRTPEEKNKAVFLTCGHIGHSLADVKSLFRGFISGSTNFVLYEEDVLYVIMAEANRALHYLGKNVIFYDFNRRHVLPAFVSDDFKKEERVVRLTKRLMHDESYIAERKYFLERPHMSFPIWFVIAFTVLISLANMEWVLKGLGIAEALGHPVSGQEWINALRMEGYSPAAVVGGSYTLCLSYMFLHASMGHLFGNMFSLYYLGSRIMEIEGVIRFAIVYILGGFLAALGDSFLTVYGGGNAEIVTVGASGAIFALAGALVIECFSNAELEVSRWKTVFWIVLSLVLSNIGANVNVTVHMIGFFSGMILMFFLRVNKIGYISSASKSAYADYQETYRKRDAEYDYIQRENKAVYRKSADSDRNYIISSER